MHLHVPARNIWRRSRALAWFAAAALLAARAAPAGAYEQWHDAVDYTKLRNALGASLPTGAGVPLAHVEAFAKDTNKYFIDRTLAEFNGSLDPTLPTGVQVDVIDATGQSGNGVSNHANNVGFRFYGDVSSVAPGANDVTIYEANDWLQNAINYDNTPNASPHPGEPSDAPYRVQNHSWIGSFGSTVNFSADDARNVDALRRFDYMIDKANGGQGMLAAVGLANNANPLPYLLAHSYNAIAVGRTDGFHSSGLTLGPDLTEPHDVYGPGRSKPDVVGPVPGTPGVNIATSWATAMVSSTATLLYDAVTEPDEDVAEPDALNSEVIKAMIMAGATKNEFPGWTRKPNGPTDYSLPLDDTYGAGEINVFNSYLTVLGGRTAGTLNQPVNAVASSGWDYKNFEGNSSIGDVFYEFNIPDGSKAQELSVVLTWNVKITDSDSAPNYFAPSESLQNLDLRLYNSSSAFPGSLVDASLSEVDNVEHIYLTNLPSGTYTLSVSGAADWDYGLAWRMNTRFLEVNADFDDSGVVDGADFLAWQRNAGTLLGATHADGDADGDGDVDHFDYESYQAGTMPLPVQAALRIAASIPEPGTLGSAAVAAGLIVSSVRASIRRRTHG